ncbi:ketol-acid reductoisomerase [Melittangium boletus]|uniref:Ketol-acid reductoisomerase (NADP(+)) n=1 Tax=Melittangium boletus DSM 14713 TaxID=1294270 RepID=A0A250IC65_9BACT|nr:ketol-acid reductoisomerase [Melittangium boletus]ATB29444.1 ketol-acid reductoisomerase [Melittangium boletus DSM 14713]
MTRVFYDADADLAALRGLTVSVYDYGSVGRAQALNLRDSGVRVLVCERPDTPGARRAAEDGFELVAARGEAARRGDVLALLVADLAQEALFREAIAPELRPGKMLLFYHGFALHYGRVKPPRDVDVVMIAPKGPGDLLRQTFVKGRGVPCLVAVHQDASGHAWERALAYGKALGATRAGLIETNFREETETDLFGEQAVLCGGTSELVRASYETLVGAGYAPEVAYFEVLHELKLVVDLMYEHGISGMRERISETAVYGDLTRGPRVVDAGVRERLKEILGEIQDGRFAREWMAENAEGKPRFKRLLEEGQNHPIEGVGRRLRAMMPWFHEG